MSLRTISIRVGADLPDGKVLPRKSMIQFTRLDTYVREDDSIEWSITPDKIEARFTDGTFEAQLEDGFYLVQEWWNSGRHFGVQVTADAAYSDLVVLDPSTLAPLVPLPPSAAQILSDASTARDAAVVSAAAAGQSATDAAASLASLVGQKGAANGIAVLGPDSRLLEGNIPDRLSLEGLSSASTWRGVDGRFPVFTRLNGGVPVLSAAAQNAAPDALVPATSASIYWPSIIDAEAILAVGTALDRYYLFDSTDHGAGGSWLFTAPTLLGPWTGRGRVYAGAVGGTSAETPSVYANPLYGQPGERRLIMLYQESAWPGAVGVQSTLWASSDDGVTWFDGGLAIDITPSTPGDGHTGYAKPTPIGTSVYAHHLRGGGDFGHFALSVSTNAGRTFLPLGMLGYGRDQTADGRMIAWNSGDIVQWRGQLLWIGMTSNFASGATPKDARLVVAPISADLRHLIGTPQPILFPVQGAETTNYRSVFSMVDRDGTLYVYYQCDDKFFVAKGL